MPAGTRARASGPPDAGSQAQDEEMEEQLPGLQFDETLAWKVGKPIPVKELLRRLELLSAELRAVDQDEIDKDSLGPVAKDLVNSNLLSHKDRGVRAWAGCCLVDVLRISAPNAPYTAAQLKDIFSLCISSLIPSLSDPSHPYNSQHLYVLKSLADFKSIILLTDVPNPGPLIHQLFAGCFDVLSGPSKADSGEELSKNVEHHMTAVLATLVDEAQSLQSDVVETVLAQFLRADPRFATNGLGKGKKTAPVDERQGTLLLKEAPPAYNMAKNICNSCPEKMARYVTRYFGAVISEVPTTTKQNATSKKKPQKRRPVDADDDEEDIDNSDSEEDWKEITKAHSLMRELWRSTPAVLQDIIPSMEGELQSQNVQLRLLAVETVGDMISGIGKGGLPPAPVMNPAAWPSQSIEPAEKSQVYNFLTTPTSPVSFISRYPHVYAGFLRRRDDPVSQIRSAWTTAVGRILSTSAGGVGLDADAEKKLLSHFADCFRDVDEKVRYSAVNAIDQLDFSTVVQTLGANGGVNDKDSVLANLAEIATDRKPLVHTEVIRLLARIWGVAAGAIAEGNERITSLLGPIPSRICDAYYKNLPEITTLVDRNMFESLLPLTYPPIKPKNPSKSQSQRIKDSQATNDEPDPDKIRTERILVFIQGLEEKARTAFLARIGHQTTLAQFMKIYLDLCEEYNGGVVDSGEKELKIKLDRVIDTFIKNLPDPSKAREDLWKFAKAHDRRNYQLIRFCIDSASDYRKIQKAIKELTKRLEENVGSGSSLITTLHTLIYRSSPLVYNRSHVPAFIEFSRNDDKGLAATAHAVLGEIAAKNPEVFKSHIQDLCRSLETEAPTAKRPDAPGGVYDLKACAQYVSKFPDNIPKDRKFLQALLGFVSYGEDPKAAKYAVQIILTVTERKQMYTKDIYKICAEDFEYGKGNFLVKLAGLSQMVLLGHPWIEVHQADNIVEIAISKVLKNSEATIPVEEGEDDPEWTESPDEHCAAKMWALKALVNSLRAKDETAVVKDSAAPVFSFLEAMVSKKGQLASIRAPKAHETRLCLLASTLLLKLAREPRFNALFSAKAFNRLATVIQDPSLEVRAGFAKKLMKYLGQKKLTNRFYTYLFLLDFEPNKTLKDSATTWLRSRAVAFARAKETAMELTFARLLSLLAHHPDFSLISKDDDDYTASLKDFARYIVFYLLTVATSENLGLIYHIAQRVKSVRDGIAPEPKSGSHDYSENLYVLSDLSQAVIRAFQDAKGWPLPSWPGKVGMPSGIFRPMPNHDTAQEIAMKRFLPDELAEDGLDDVVKSMLRTGKKRRSDSTGDPSATSRKRVKSVGSGAADKAKKEARKEKKRDIKTPKRKAKKARDFDASDNIAPSSERRRSSRQTGQKSYLEASDDEDEAMADVGDEEEEEDEEEDAQSDVNAEGTPEAGAQQSDSELSEASESTVETKKPAKSARKQTTGRGAASKTNGHAKKQTKAKAPARSTRSTRNGTKDAGTEVLDISSDKSSSLSDLSDEN